MTKHIFISYARKDARFAQKLNSDLKQEGLFTWIDDLSLRSGDDWLEHIAHAIDDSFAVLAILSPDAVNSKWVKRELRYADKLGKKIFPLLYKKCNLPHVLELQFGSIQRIDFTVGEYSKKTAKLTKDIKRIIKTDQARATSGAFRGLQIDSTSYNQELELSNVLSGLNSMDKVKPGRLIDSKPYLRTYLAKTVDGEIPISLDLVYPAYATFSDVLEEYERRATITAYHPNFRRIYGLGKITNEEIEGLQLEELPDLEKYIWIASDYTGTTTLYEKIDMDGELDFRLSAKVISMLASVIQLLHNRELYFGSINSKLLWFSSDESLKLIYPDLSKIAFDAHRKFEDVVVSSNYSLPFESPEQIIDGKFNQRSDIYSFGLLIYEMLTGYFPFSYPLSHQGVQKLFQRKLVEGVPLPSALNPKIPSHVDKAILKALEKDPRKRFSSVESFIKALSTEQ